MAYIPRHDPEAFAAFTLVKALIEGMLGHARPLLEPGEAEGLLDNARSILAKIQEQAAAAPNVMSNLGVADAAREAVALVNSIETVGRPG